MAKYTWWDPTRGKSPEPIVLFLHSTQCCCFNPQDWMEGLHPGDVFPQTHTVNTESIHTCCSISSVLLSLSRLSSRQTSRSLIFSPCASTWSVRTLTCSPPESSVFTWGLIYRGDSWAVPNTHCCLCLHQQFNYEATFHAVNWFILHPLATKAWSHKRCEDVKTNQISWENSSWEKLVWKS